MCVVHCIMFSDVAFVFHTYQSRYSNHVCCTLHYVQCCGLCVPHISISTYKSCLLYTALCSVMWPLYFTHRHTHVHTFLQFPSLIFILWLSFVRHGHTRTHMHTHTHTHTLTHTHAHARTHTQILDSEVVTGIASRVLTQPRNTKAKSQPLTSATHSHIHMHTHAHTHRSWTQKW